MSQGCPLSNRLVLALCCATGALALATPSAPARRAAPLPNLLVSRLAVASQAGVGGRPFQVDETTANRGHGRARASRTLFFLSRDRVRDRADIRLGGRRVPALGAGRPSGARSTLTIPASAPAAATYLIACADGERRVRESDETDNCRSAALGGRRAGSATPRRRLEGDLVYRTTHDDASPGISAGTSTVPSSKGEHHRSVEIAIHVKLVQDAQDDTKWNDAGSTVTRVSGEGRGRDEGSQDQSTCTGSYTEAIALGSPPFLDGAGPPSLLAFGPLDPAQLAAGVSLDITTTTTTTATGPWPNGKCASSTRTDTITLGQEVVCGEGDEAVALDPEGSPVISFDYTGARSNGDPETCRGTLGPPAQKPA